MSHEPTIARLCDKTDRCVVLSGRNYRNGNRRRARYWNHQAKRLLRRVKKALKHRKPIPDYDYKDHFAQ